MREKRCQTISADNSKVSKLFITIFLMSIGVCSFFRGYSQASITGKVYSKDGKPLEFVTVSIQSQQSGVKTTITDSTGAYSLQASTAGIYTVYFSLVNYELVKMDLRNGCDTLINIVLHQKSIDLNGVTIYRKKPLIERRIDRLIFNVQNSIVATGGDALDALKSSPGIRVNNDNISIIGRTGVNVMLNGRLIQLSGNELVNYLKSIRSDDIASIEVITTPPANYDAQGNSGLINIVLKKGSKNNFSGDINASYAQTTYAAGKIGASLNYQKDKLSFSMGVVGGDGSNGPQLNNSVYYRLQAWESESIRRNYTRYFNGRVSADYKLSGKSTVGIQYMGGVGGWDIRDNEQTTIRNSKDNTIDSVLKTNSYSQSNNFSHAINTNYQLEIDSSGKRLTFDADYFSYGNNQDRLFSTKGFPGNEQLVEQSFYSQDNLAKQNIHIYSSKVDLVLPYKFGTFEIGGKISFIKNNSNVTLFNLTGGKPMYDSAQSNTFVYKENTQALYASFSKKLFRKLETKIGLRLEATQTNGFSGTIDQENKNTYLRLFPTAYLMYAFNDKHLLSLNYGRRIGRPNYNALNPFRWYNNPYVYTEGNPMLQPSYTDVAEIAYTFKENLISSLYFNRTSGGYGQITMVAPNTNIQVTRSENYFNEFQAGWSESYTFKPLPFWESYNQFSIYYSHSKSLIQSMLPKLEGTGAFAATNNSFSLNKKKATTIECNYWYQFPESSGLSKTEGYSQLDLGVKFSLCNNKIQSIINLVDVFATSRALSTTYYNNIKETDKNYFDIRMIRISLSYKLGNKNVKSQQHNTGNEEEKKRAN